MDLSKFHLPCTSFDKISLSAFALFVSSCVVSILWLTQQSFAFSLEHTMLGCRGVSTGLVLGQYCPLLGQQLPEILCCMGQWCNFVDLCCTTIEYYDIWKLNLVVMLLKYACTFALLPLISVLMQSTCCVAWSRMCRLLYLIVFSVMFQNYNVSIVVTFICYLYFMAGKERLYIVFTSVILFVLLKSSLCVHLTWVNASMC